MTATEDFYAWKKDERVDRPALDKRHLDLHRRLLPLETVVIEWEEALRVVNDNVLQQSEVVIDNLRDKLVEITELGWLVAPSSTPIDLEEGQQRAIIIVADERELFTPGPISILTRAATTDDYAIVQTIAYDRASGQFDFTILTVTGDPGPHTDWQVAAVAGSTLAQMGMLATGQAVRDETETLRDEAVAAKVEVLTAAANILEIAEEIQEGPVASVNGHTGVILLDAGDVGAYSTTEVDGLLSAKASTTVMNAALAAITGSLPDKASSVIALAGTDDVDYMTAVRTKDSVEKFGGGFGSFYSVNENVAITSAFHRRSLAFQGNYTIAMPAASSVPVGFCIHVRNRVTNAIGTVASSTAFDGAGASSLKVYQEQFTIWSDGTTWRTHGRPRGWILIGTTSVVSAVASVDFSAGFNDSELRDMLFRGNQITRSGGAGTIQLVAGWSKAGVFTNGTMTLSNSQAENTNIFNTEVLLPRFATAPQTGLADTSWHASTGNVVGFFATAGGMTSTTGALDGFRLYFSTGSVSSGNIVQMGYRT